MPCILWSEIWYTAIQSRLLINGNDFLIGQQGNNNKCNGQQWVTSSVTSIVTFCLHDSHSGHKPIRLGDETMLCALCLVILLQTLAFAICIHLLIYNVNIFTQCNIIISTTMALPLMWRVYFIYVDWFILPWIYIGIQFCRIQTPIDLCSSNKPNLAAAVHLRNTKSTC